MGTWHTRRNTSMAHPEAMAHPEDILHPKSTERLPPGVPKFFFTIFLKIKVNCGCDRMSDEFAELLKAKY